MKWATLYSLMHVYETKSSAFLPLAQARGKASAERAVCFKLTGMASTTFWKKRGPFGVQALAPPARQAAGRTLLRRLHSNAHTHREREQVRRKTEKDGGSGEEKPVGSGEEK